jgi:hypothetical protein
MVDQEEVDARDKTLATKQMWDSEKRDYVIKQRSKESE